MKIFVPVLLLCFLLAPVRATTTGAPAATQPRGLSLGAYVESQKKQLADLQAEYEALQTEQRKQAQDYGNRLAAMRNALRGGPATQPNAGQPAGSVVQSNSPFAAEIAQHTIVNGMSVSDVINAFRAPPAPSSNGKTIAYVTTTQHVSKQTSDGDVWTFTWSKASVTGGRITKDADSFELARIRVVNAKVVDFQIDAEEVKRWLATIDAARKP